MMIYMYIITIALSHRQNVSNFHVGKVTLERKLFALTSNDVAEDFLTSSRSQTITQNMTYRAVRPKNLTTLTNKIGNIDKISKMIPKLKDKGINSEFGKSAVGNSTNDDRKALHANSKNDTKEIKNTEHNELHSTHISKIGNITNSYVTIQNQEWCEDLTLKYPLVINASKILESDGKPVAGIKPIHFHPFKYIYNPTTVCFDGRNNIRILSVVKSKVTNFLIREAIRRTWGKIASNGPYRLVFAVGHSQNKRTRRQVQVEYARYGDIIQENFMDTYYNNSLKTIMTIRWVATHCYRAEFVFLVDDDVMVNFSNLLNHVNTIPHNVAETLYSGNRKFEYPERKKGKWRVSLKEFPYDCYPSYISGGAILTSGHVIRKFNLLLPYVKRYKLDDIYISILAQKLGITPTHNNKMSMKKKKIPVLREMICSHGFSKYRNYIDTYRNMMATLSHSNFQ